MKNLELRKIIFMFFMSSMVSSGFALDDCYVGLNDLAAFCEDWLVTNDLDDFATFAGTWLDESPWYYCNEEAPVAYDTAESATQYEPQLISFSASDDGRPRPPKHLKYMVTALPANGYAANKLVQGAGKITAADTWLTGWADEVIFATDTAGEHVISFKAYDGELWSDEADVTITVAAAAMDHLSFDGGSVSVPDDTYLDAADGWAVDFWIKTLQADTAIMSKRSGSGAGYEIELEDGCPKITFYDGSGSITAKHADAANSGDWEEVCFSLAVSGSDYTVFSQILGWSLTVEHNESGAYGSFENAEPVVISGIYCIDKLRFFAGISNPDAIGEIIQGWNGRTEGETYSMGFYAESEVMFACDEGSGTTITDSKEGYVGTFSGGVYWYNRWWDWDRNGMQKIEN
jgi:hypothetical protein